MGIFLANCSVDESRKYANPLVIPYEKVSASSGKITLSQHKVLLNVNFGVDEVESITSFLRNPGIATCVTVDPDVNIPNGAVSSAPEGVFVFVKTTLDDIREANFGPLEAFDPGIRVLVDPGEGVEKDLRRLVSLCKKYPNVRINGGNIFRVDGLRIGMFDAGEIKGIGDGPATVCNGKYDSFEVVNLVDLTGVEEVIRKVTRKTSTTKPKVTMIDLTDEKKTAKKSAKKASPKPEKPSLFSNSLEGF